MKKLLFLAAVGVFSFASFAGNGSIENESSLKEAADFPVYCDGVYVGNASTIQEGIDMCD